MRVAHTVITALLLLSGCVGGIEDPPPSSGVDAGTTPTGKLGKANYIANVHAIVQKCSGAACHSQTGVTTGMYGFAIPDASASYDVAITLPTLVGTFTATSAGLLTKFATMPTHKDVVLSADDRTKINAWFAQELADRMTPGSMQPPVIDAVAKLREWSGCMKIADFNTALMPAKWGALATVQNQRCANCHALGASSFMSGDGTATAQTYFDTITTQKDLLLKYFTVDAMGQVIVNMGAFNSAGVTLEGHPRFNPTVNPGMDALKLFYDATKLNLTNVTCDPPRLPL